MFTATIWMQRDAGGLLGVELLIVRETRISSFFCGMGIILNSKGSLYGMKVLIIKLVMWLGWLSCVAVGQLEVSEAVTGFVNFPEVGISCIGNLAVFITSISKGRLDLEMGARDVFATLRGPKLQNINNAGNGRVRLTTSQDYMKASVVMLSYNGPDSTMKQFMRYNSNAHGVQSIFLSCKSAAAAGQGLKETCKHGGDNTICKCIVFEDVKGITDLIDWRMPGTLKLLLESNECLLPCAGCLKNGCHGCNEGNEDRSGGGDPEPPDATEREPNVKFIPPVCEILEYYDNTGQKDRSCICIPVSPPADDEWTKRLTTSFRTKDNEDRRVSVMASDAMENYTAQEPKGTRMDLFKGRKNLREGIIVKFGISSLLLPRLTEILINLLLVVWFRVDGFSTSMVARKAVKIYVVGSKESGFAANTFLRTALVKSANNTKSDSTKKDNDTHICQLLTFRNPLLNLRKLSFIAGTVNLLCSIFWAVFIASEGNKGKWYDIHPMPPSIPIVAVIIVAIGIALGMDCLHIYLYWRDRKDIKKQGREENTSEKPRKVPPIMPVCAPIMPVCAVIVVEIICILSGSVALGVWGKKPFKTWVYSVVQALVWLKWGIGSYLLGELHSESNSEYNWKSGILVYSSSFFLNFMLAAVRSSWKYSPQV